MAKCHNLLFLITLNKDQKSFDKVDIIEHLLNEAVSFGFSSLPLVIEMSGGKKDEV